MALVNQNGVLVDDETGEVVGQVTEFKAESASEYDPIANGDLAKWYNLSAELSAVKDEEMALRRKIVSALFPDIWEGTESHTLPDGAVCKGKGVITRNIDLPVLTNLRESFTENGISVDLLVEWKPSLKLAEYRKLGEAERILFDQALTIKPGAPGLEIVVPKGKRK